MARDVASDLALVLEASTLGLARPPAMAANLFLGALPEDDDFSVPDVAVAILSTGGANVEPYLGGRSAYMRATCQVLVRGPREDYETGQLLALGVHSALTLPELDPYVYVKVRESAPFRLPTDGSDRPLWSLNVEAQYSSELGDAPTVVGDVGGGASSSVFKATCTVADVPGCLVVFAAPDSSGVPSVITASAAVAAGIPALGVILRKTTDTTATVQRSGLFSTQALGVPPLTPGRPVFLGFDGRPTTTVPQPESSPTGDAWVQPIGVALGPYLVDLAPSLSVVRLG